MNSLSSDTMFGCLHVCTSSREPHSLRLCLPRRFDFPPVINFLLGWHKRLSFNALGHSTLLWTLNTGRVKLPFKKRATARCPHTCLSPLFFIIEHGPSLVYQGWFKQGKIRQGSPFHILGEYVQEDEVTVIRSPADFILKVSPGFLATFSVLIAFKRSIWLWTNWKAYGVQYCAYCWMVETFIVN